MALLNSYSNTKFEAGCDEAGRGCLSGPVFAAAVILPVNFTNLLLNDSKQLNEKKRYALRTVIEKEALAWAVGTYSPSEIDKVNILNASIYSMHRALDKLTVRPDFIIVDGNKFKEYRSVTHECIIKGDGKYLSIAAASVLAKTYRDDYMLELDKEFPEYGWSKNKGYPTKIHKAAIAEFGITDHHRKTFRLGDSQLKLEL